MVYKSSQFFFIYRSTDYGSTYERMNDKVGSKTVLSYLYVCPSNKRKVRQTSKDGTMKTSVLISSDEGASYQNYHLSFYILSPMFHPTQDDWDLAYSHGQKLYASLEFGRKWQLVHEHVNRFYWVIFDEGRQWARHSFSLVPLFMEGMLVEAGIEIQIMTVIFDEGRQWARHSFSLVPLFVEGMLVEAGTEIQIITGLGTMEEWRDDMSSDERVGVKVIIAMNGVEKGTVYQHSGSTQLSYQGAAAKDRSTSSAQGELHIVSAYAQLVEGCQVQESRDE
ncbi:VPS10 domain-containing receptor SorCS1-like [Oncorhynchus kisutch]|uniref:VPS10 domain-containing receptor SorCS1-like n=1 Tax=Oncorhynchus kisutch TaxID=8019 RepID=UPI00099FD575|nr:VPS10 domain-containing receptor SorCS1-like [Oncorhynchus kisutch]